MKGKIYTVIFLLSSYISFSQSPEDALRLSWFQLKGTARNQAIGGAMVSLGGDATANHINPAAKISHAAVSAICNNILHSYFGYVFPGCFGNGRYSNSEFTYLWNYLRDDKYYCLCLDRDPFKEFNQYLWLIPIGFGNSITF